MTINIDSHILNVSHEKLLYQNNMKNIENAIQKVSQKSLNKLLGQLKLNAFFHSMKA